MRVASLARPTEWSLRIKPVYIKMILRDWPPKVQEDCRTVPVTLRYNGTSAYRSLPLHQRCEANGPTSGHPIIIGAGLGGTATRSVAAAVWRLGFATCHWTGGNHDALVDASRSGDVIGPFSRADAWFDNPMAALLVPLACVFPNYRVVLTTRSATVQKDHPFEST